MHCTVLYCSVLFCSGILEQASKRGRVYTCIAILGREGGASLLLILRILHESFRDRPNRSLLILVLCCPAAWWLRSAETWRRSNDERWRCC